MSGALIVGCGGTGREIIGNLAAEGRDCLYINWEDADINLPSSVTVPDRSDQDKVLSAFRSIREDVLGRMRGFSSIVLIASPGGVVGRVSVRCVSEWARENGSRFVIIATVPFAFEDRRENAIAALPEIVGAADRVFIADLQYSGLIRMNIGDVVDAVDMMVSVVARNVSDMLGSIPFFSTFVSPVYSFSRGYSDHILDSFDEAASNPMFSLDMVGKRAVICTDGPMDDETADALVSYVTNLKGSVPDLIRGKGEGEGLTVFVPISLRSE